MAFSEWKDNQMRVTERVLIVEDRPDLVQRFREIVETLGVEVDTACSKKEAIEKVRCRTYHLALVDIMLAGDDIMDRGGIDVLKYINSLNEGTKAIVASGSHDVRVPVEVWNQGALKYLVKRDIKGSEDLLDPVRDGLKDVSLKLYGFLDNIIAYLAHPGEAASYEDQILFGWGEGAAAMSELLSKVFAPVLPVLKSRNSGIKFCLDQNQKTLAGPLWSKGLGRPIWVLLGPSTSSVMLPEGVNLETILETHVGGLTGRIWLYDTCPRSYFEEHLPMKSDTTLNDGRPRSTRPKGMELP